ncbi:MULTISPECIES: hypothetical protein [unclassified Paenibacillus]|uniref:hypothetical protein n=1 Tax=unclassified Paenibacillus TaxID=185978 RepID=UPI001AE1FB36|nr:MULTISPECIES: hypothetical protein [unclassified Paenibacillus]MBP1154303.1 hypothetical protein [Paenibacillus sp. PvP091]MBP1170313.1 hypothetical protein [Paenibacillus sp. PvR098]MBP2441341.1 hypothetical protein [Paenibacillus sp. PvP052]
MFGIVMFAGGSIFAVVAPDFTVFLIGRAAQGKQSHFNLETPFDASLYSIMGITIVIVTVTAIILLIYLLVTRLNLAPHLALALRMGLFISIIGSVIGGYMAGNNRHTVGGQDGGEGLFFLNWSTLLGDLRVPHFFGLHALQLIPLITYLVTLRVKSPSRKLWISWIVSLLYLGFVGFSFIQAAQGQPFIGK